MSFAFPTRLWLLAALPALVAAAWLFARGRRRALARFAGGDARAGAFLDEVNPHLRVVRALLALVAATAGIVALARPQWGTRLEPVTRKGVDVVLALDTSRSMAAQDASPDRLSRAKHGAASLVKSLAGNRIALVTFAGKAVIDCPLTLDAEAVRLFLDAAEIDSVPARGTSLAEAVRVAIRAFGPAAGGEERSRVLVIFSDGEDHEGGEKEALDLLGKARVSVFAVGYGTRRGAPIPSAPGDPSTAGYKEDREGRVVTTRLEEEFVGELAVESGGRYFDATGAESEIEEIAQAVAAMDAREFGTVLRARYEERFQIPLALALAALVALTVVPDRRRSGARGPERRTVE